MRRVGGLALAAAALGWLAACGDGETTSPTRVPTPTPTPVISVVAQGGFTISAPDRDWTYYQYSVINTTAAGKLETTVNWTYPTNTLWMYMAEGDCTGDKFANPDCPGGPTCACRFSVTSEVEGPKPRVLTVPNASPGARTLIVWNLGPKEESCSYQAVLTTTVAGFIPPGLQSAGGERAKRTTPRLVQGW
jgi:hypothetical protein